MKNLNYLLILFIATFTLVACGKKGTDNKEPNKETTVEKLQNMALPEEFMNQVETYSLTPDSLLSANQLNEKMKAYEIIKKGIVLENGKLVNKTTEGEFIDHGLSKYWAALLQQNVDQLNDMAEKNDSINLTEIYNLMQQNINAGLNPNFKYEY